MSVPRPRLASSALPAAVRPNSTWIRRIFGALAAASLLALSSGCSDGTVIRDDAKITYVVHGDAEVSERDIDWVVEQVEDLARLFDVEPPHFTYHYYLGVLIPAGGACPVYDDRVLPCHYERTIYSHETVHTHELVHLVQAQRARFAPFLEEGLADLLGNSANKPEGDFDTAGAIFGRPDLVHLLRTKWLTYVDDVGSDRAYNTAASVARYFLDELGWDGLLTLGEATSGAEADEELEFALETAFGMTVAEIEDGYVASVRYPSERHDWALPSLLRTIEEGESVDFQTDHTPSLRFEHDSSMRTLLTLEGGSGFQVERLDAGLVHPQALQPFLDQVLKIAIDGPSGSYVFRPTAGSGTLTLRREALDAELELDPLIVLGTAGAHTPVCVAGNKHLTIYNLGIERSFDYGFISGRPATLDVCRESSCETLNLWDGPLIINAEFDAPGCLVPSSDYPKVNATLDQGDFPAAPGSGRFVVYELAVKPVE